MSIVLSTNRYGKANIRVVKVIRSSEVHQLKELTVQVLLEGPKFEQAYVHGDNTMVIPTDTMKNTVFILAKEHNVNSIEEFGAYICKHFLQMYQHVAKVRVDIVEHLWARMLVGKDRKPHSHSFQRASPETHTVTVNGTRNSIDYESGLDNLLVLKTTGSGFAGYYMCKNTTLKPTTDRILSTNVLCKWKYKANYPKQINFNYLWEEARQIILDTFAIEYSKAVQETIWVAGKRILEKFPEIEQVWFSLPNKHVFIFDLSRFGLENKDEVFTPLADPNGLIEATITRQNSKL